MARRRAHNEDEQLEQIAQRLRAERPELDPLHLDQIRTATLARARRGGRSGMRRRLAVAALTVGLMAAGTGGVIAAGGASQTGGNAATAQYGQGGVKGSQEHHSRTRSLHFHIRVPAHVRLRKITIELNGKTIFVLRGHSVSANVKLKLPCDKHGTVKLIAVTSSGHTITETRLLLTCGK